MRTVVVLFCLLSIAVTTVAEDSDESEFKKKLAKANKAIADSHYRLAKGCFKLGLNVSGHEESKFAFACVPDHEKTRKLLGFKFKDDKWQIQPKKAPPKKDSERATQRFREAYIKDRDKQWKEAAREYVKLALWAGKHDFPTRARVLFEKAARFDPLNERALVGAGWEKDKDGLWIKPAQIAERAELQALLKKMPDAKPIEDPPTWLSKLADVIGSEELSDVKLFRTDHGIPDAGKKLWLTARIAETCFGKSKHNKQAILVFSKAKHQKYVSLRCPETPGFKDNDYIVADDEIEVQCSSKGEPIDLERAVYAFALREVQARIGEDTPAWLEVGFASNVTRRLLGSVQTAEHDGIAEGPAQSGRWKRTIKQTIDDFELGVILAADTLTESELIQAHFFTRWLMQKHRTILNPLIKALSSKADSESALEQALDEPLITLQEQFIDWIQNEL